MDQHGKHELPKGLSIAGMVLGIVGITFAIIPCFWILSWLILIIDLAGLALSIIALIQCNKGQQTGKGMALTGIVCSGLSLILIILSMFWFVSLFNDLAPALDLLDELDKISVNINGIIN